MDESGLARPMAAQWLRNALASAGAGGSLYKLFKDQLKFDKERNRRECMSLARVLDCLLKKERAKAQEHLVRRLAGVHAADATDDWQLCDQFELVMDRTSFVPDEHMQRAVKNVMRMRALESSNKAHKSKGLGGSGGAGGRPKKNNSNTKPQQKPAGRPPYNPSGTGAHSKGASHKKADSAAGRRGAGSEE